MGHFLTPLRAFAITWLSPELVRLDRDVGFRSARGPRVVVPAGFVCDLASVPGWLASLAPSWRQTSRAGALHDFLYRRGARPSLSRAACDGIFREALRADGCGAWAAARMWAAVRIGGGSSYRAKTVGFGGP